MAQRDMVRYIQQRALKMQRPLQLTEGQTTDLVGIVRDYLTHELETHGEVTYHQFGKWTVKKRAQRLGRNPQTGASMTIAETNVVGFRPALPLKTLIAQGRHGGNGTARRAARARPTAKAAPAKGATKATTTRRTARA
jgi:DNA-binding protein HU-alpha